MELIPLNNLRCTFIPDTNCFCISWRYPDDNIVFKVAIAHLNPGGEIVHNNIIYCDPNPDKNKKDNYNFRKITGEDKPVFLVFGCTINHNPNLTEIMNAREVYGDVPIKCTGFSYVGKIRYRISYMEKNSENISGGQVDINFHTNIDIPADCLLYNIYYNNKLITYSVADSFSVCTKDNEFRTISFFIPKGIDYNSISLSSDNQAIIFEKADNSSVGAFERVKTFFRFGRGE